MKSSAKPEPKARAAADSQDSLESSGSPNSADDTGEDESKDEQERASEPSIVSTPATPAAPTTTTPAPATTPALESSEAKSKRKAKASRAGSEPNNVRKLRQEAMMSKAELARRAGVSPLTIDRVEAGSPCRMDTKRKILEALGLKPEAREQVFGPDIDQG